MGRAARRWLFAPLPAVGLLLAVEGAARLAGEPALGGGAGAAVFPDRLPPELVEDAELGWAPRPGAVVHDPNLPLAARGLGAVAGPEEPTRHDPRGWREADPPPPAPAGPQVLVVGDSSVWGSGVPWSGCLGPRLAQEAAAAGRAVDVRTGAAAGWSSVQVLGALERWFRDGARPAVVLLYLGNSDQMQARGTPDAAWARGADARLRPWLGRSAALRRALALRDALRPPPAAHDGPRVDPATFALFARRIVDRVRAAGAAPVLLLPPLPPDLGDNPSERPGPTDTPATAAACRATIEAQRAAPRPNRSGYRCALRLLAAEAAVPLVDGPAAVRAAATPASGPLFWDLIHPSAAGHAALAAAAWPVVEAALGGSAGAEGG